MTFSERAVEAAAKITPQRRAELKWPEKSRARRLVRDAIKRGDLVRPSECSECGSRPGHRSDGRALIHAHHFAGYDHPLTVKWLCVSCHAKEDQRPLGKSHGQSKLDETAVFEIIHALKNGATERGTARIYNVSPRTINRIKTGECWRKALTAASDGEVG